MKRLVKVPPVVRCFDRTIDQVPQSLARFPRLRSLRQVRNRDSYTAVRIDHFERRLLTIFEIELRLLDEQHWIRLRESRKKLLRPLPHEVPSQMAECQDAKRQPSLQLNR